MHASAAGENALGAWMETYSNRPKSRSCNAAKRGASSDSRMAVELSAIRESELAPLLAALQDLDLGRFEYVSIHAPSAFSPAAEACIFQELYEIRHRQWPIVVHPDTLYDFSLWRCLGSLLCVENMD